MLPQVWPISKLDKRGSYVNNKSMNRRNVAVVSADVLSCRSSKLIKLLSPVGYLSNLVSSTSSPSSAAECIDGGPEWLIEASPGQRINVTLWDFGHRFQVTYFRVYLSICWKKHVTNVHTAELKAVGIAVALGMTKYRKRPQRTAKDRKGALHMTTEDRQSWENCQTCNNFV